MKPNSIRAAIGSAAGIFRKGLLLLGLGVLGACVSYPAPQPEMRSGERLVLFTYAGQAKSVCLSGDFNGWSPDSLCLKMEAGRWAVRVPLPRGRHRYGFILDGERWVPDPKALLHEEDGFGQKNSIIFVE